MLSYFTWNHFFLTAGITLLLYYLIVVLLYYRKEIKNGLALFRLPPEQDSPTSTPVTGEIISEYLPDLSETTAIQLAPLSPQASESTLHPDNPETILLETWEDLFGEVTSLLELASEYKTGKEEFCTLLRLIIVKYSMMIPDRLRDQVNRYLLEQNKQNLPFELTLDDILALWPTNDE